MKHDTFCVSIVHLYRSSNIMSESRVVSDHDATQVVPKLEQNIWYSPAVEAICTQWRSYAEIKNPIKILCKITSSLVPNSVLNVPTNFKSEPVPVCSCLTLRYGLFFVCPIL